MVSSLPRLAAPLALLALSALLVQITVPYSGGWSLFLQTLFHYNTADYQQLITNLTYLPRLAMALVCGFALALAGCVMQFILRNPIAAPTTLGVATGAQLGMVLSILLIPPTLALPMYLPALASAAVCTALVFWMAAKKGLAPIHLVLSGMVVNLFVGAINTMLMLVNERHLSSVFIWGAGALNQSSWEPLLRMLPWLTLTAIGIALLQRPLSALALGDGVSNNLGVNVKRLKLLALSLTIFMTAVVVCEVGIIGFVGIVAPGIVRLLGVRRLPWQLLFSGLMGSLMLLLADLLSQPISQATGELLPTGAMTALFGAPFLLWLLQRQRWPAQLKSTAEAPHHYHRTSFIKVISLSSLALVIAMLLALGVNQDAQGFHVSYGGTLMELRLPRVLGACFAGIGLAMAGTLIQRLTHNPMSSPEVLGMSSGAALTLVLCSFFGLTLLRYEQILLGSAGALGVTVLLWWLGRKQHFEPAQLLLTGIALSAGLDAILRITLAGQENASALLTWLSGSTYLLTHADVAWLAAGTLILACLPLALHRWFDLIELGAVSASSVGLNCLQVRRLTLILVALLTTLCTAFIGPLTFIGLLAPHMARALQQHSALKQMLTAAVLGALVMVLADWVGRVLWFPWQFPAGLLSSLIGGAYFLYLMRR